ncbi:uncharacterized protein LOC131224991 [Magnolia sinica]|uniref:uncharacterized protein LOC131224991 n=1 Tax=Magnolia sinica TaxID=86752 RepID=UPI0026596860|nr:uncharacterized protein LOC131224991 [Magnolia sinica]
MTRQVLMPFDDNAFTNAKMLEYTDLLCEPTDIAIGQTFKDKSQCQYVLSQFAIRNNFQYRVIYSNSRRFTVVYFEDACEWRVHASRENDTGIFKIQTYESKHTCGMTWMKSDHRQASSKLACDLVISRIEQRLGLRPADIIFAMQEKYNIRISYWKAWKARELAINHVMGSYEDSYNQLPLYLHELRRANPGTVTAISVNQQTWRTHLKGKYKGVLFIATALDGDNHIFPLAFDIGELENNSS